jgi:hypothetical protein
MVSITVLSNYPAWHQGKITGSWNFSEDVQVGEEENLKTKIFWLPSELSPVLVDEDLNPVSQGLIQVVSEFNELLVTHLCNDAEMYVQKRAHTSDGEAWCMESSLLPPLNAMCNSIHSTSGVSPKCRPLTPSQNTHTHHSNLSLIHSKSNLVLDGVFSATRENI